MADRTQIQAIEETEFEMRGIDGLRGSARDIATETVTSASSGSQAERRTAEAGCHQSLESAFQAMRVGPSGIARPAGGQSGAASFGRRDRLSDREINTAQQRIRNLRNDFAERGKTAGLPQDPSYTEYVEAGLKVLDYWADLPSASASVVLPNRKVIELRNSVLQLLSQSTKEILAHVVNDLDPPSRDAVRALDNTLHSTLTLDDEIKARSNAAKTVIPRVDAWAKVLRNAERMYDILASTANLDNAPARTRVEASQRTIAGDALYYKFMQLASRIVFAEATICPRTIHPRVAEILQLDDGRLRLLSNFREDLFPAFRSVMQPVTGTKGKPLDRNHRNVLEGVMERLSEFAFVMGKLVDPEEAADGHSELLRNMMEDAWVTANHVMRVLALQPELVEMAEDKQRRRKAKGKRSPDPSASGAPASRVQSQAGASEPDPEAEVIALSELGTKRLVNAAEANAAMSSSAKENLKRGSASPSQAELTQLLERLNELSSFDLAGQQRRVSEARRMKPEDADHITSDVLKRLQAKVTEMDACMSALNELRRWSLFALPQAEMHDKIRRLEVKRAEVNGQATAVAQLKNTIEIECMKTYAFPSQNYLQRLQDEGQLSYVGLPRALKEEPGTLFEFRVQPKALQNRLMPRPMWVHVHTNRTIHARELVRLKDADFAACHVKSDEQRGYNRQWQNAQAALGRENVEVYRGKLTSGFCQFLLDKAATDERRRHESPTRAA
ncbi:hypothetical protein ML401_35420 (plasmid) [Bradyrhizobium sp. 62B]|uniref:hypothetical protein n=2 Tax=Pseudomonadota TaxID=1224 RepID=UPI002557D752|nr:hypothetical protein ML401_35420 [Bradyrhizobium sp. 62B]